MFSVVVLVLASVCLSCSGQPSGDIRLWMNGSTSLYYAYGRLQIYIGQKWNEVCDDDFGRMEANVACHQLGFINSDDPAGSGYLENDITNLTSSIGLSEVYCPTDDYLHLLRCSFQLGLHSCSGEGYTMLQCDSTRIWDTPFIGQLRLTGGKYSSQGLVQIYCDRGWGTICSGYPFAKTEADTVCRQLGYTESIAYNHLYSLGDNTALSILLSDVQCPTDTEQCLGACKLCSQRVDTSYCYNRLTVECKFDTLEYSFGSNVSTCEYEDGGFIKDRPQIGEVRLVPPSGQFEGVAELNYNVSGDNNTWSRICYESSNNQTVADTFCTQLGYSGASEYSSSSVSLSSDTPYLSVSCSQQYPHLLWCSVLVTNSCSSILMVTCFDSGSYYTGQVRLRDGDYPSEGRVEIYVYDAWSSLYTDGYGYDEVANSICRQLGYTGADYYDTGLLPGSGKIRITYPNCYRERACFSNCLYRSDFTSEQSVYSHDYDLSVNCTFNRTLAPSITIGSESLCEIEEPSTSDNIRGGIVALIVLPIIIFIACVVVVAILTISIVCAKKSKRRARQRQAAVGPIGYNPQAPTGQAVYMVPVNQIPPTGILLVPPQGTNQVQSQTTTDDEEKRLPPNTDEVFQTTDNSSAQLL